MSNPASRQSALAKTEPSFAVPRTMLAAVARRFGAPDDVRVEAVLVPTAGNDQVLVRVHAASVCRGDIHLLAGKPYLVRLAGFELSGRSTAFPDRTYRVSSWRRAGM